MAEDIPYRAPKPLRGGAWKWPLKGTRGCALIGVCAFGLVANRLTAAAARPEGNSETEKFVFRAWGTDAGLPQNTVNAVLQSRDGYLWLGTQGGLAQFDGVRFAVWGLADGLPSDQVRTLHEDSEGSLWIGTTGGGLSRLREGKLETFSVEHGLADVNVTALEADTQGRLWVGTSAGLSVWDGDRFVHLESLDELGHPLIRTLLRDRQGTMWISTATGLFEFDHGRLKECIGPPGDATLSPYCLLEDREGNLWASIGNGKVLCRRNRDWTTYNETSGLPFAYVSSLAEDADGTIWAGSLDQGLYYFNGTRFIAVQSDDKYSGHAIRSLLVDREGILWVGTRTSGLNRLTRQRFEVFGATQGLTNDFVRGVAESPDGTLWVSTIGGGLYRGWQGKFTPFTNAPFAQGFPFVESVLITRQGELCWGGAGALFRWHDGQVTSYTRSQVPWLANAGVTALLEDVARGLWIGTTEGRLFLLRDGEFQALTNRVARGAVTALAQAADSTLWVGSAAGGLSQVSQHGVVAYSTTNGLLSNQIRTLHLDASGVLWIGTGGGGMSRLRNGQIFNFTSRLGLGDDTVSQILEDEEGRLWLGCNRGIFRVRKSDLEALAAGRLSLLPSRAFGLADGLPAEECSGGFSPAGLRTRAGKLCFATVRGVVLLDPRETEAQMSPPSVLIQEATVHVQVQPILHPRPPVPSPEHPALALTIKPGQTEIEFRYTGLNFSAPEKIQFRYRLDYYDRDWVEARLRRVAYYPRLPPGKFTFRVAAANADGVWHEAALPLVVTVLPRFWESGWFLAAAVLGVILALGGAVRLVERRKYRRRLARLETQHAIERERLRISQDMHDDVGSILTRVSILSDVAQSETSGAPTAKASFERIGVQVRSAVQALDEIVWATNPQNDNLLRFAEYVGRFADECFENTKIRCWQEIPTDLPALPLRADARHNVFLAVKEALHNVLKHARADQVWVRLAVEDNRVHLEIEDNGRGFVPEHSGPEGNGLKNMKSRLEECGGLMRLSTEPGKGSKIQFAFNLTHPDSSAGT